MLHPVACLLVWLILAIVVQFYGWSALLAVGLGLLLLKRGVARRWWKQVLRAKWLFLSLWLILAYGIPGELWQGRDWAPSLEGMEMATLHAGRLLVLFGSIAGLFEILPHERFVSGLWLMAQPLQRMGWQVEHSVARLALVFDYLEKAPPRGSWRHFLEWSAEGAGASETVRVTRFAWRAGDTIFLLVGWVVLPLLLLVN